MFRTAAELSTFVKKVIDARWKLETSEQEMLDHLSSTFSDVHNRELVFRGNAFSPTFERQLGKKRIEFLKSVLTQIDSKRYCF